MSSIRKLSGKVIGHYELRELLGAGGMGAVYHAWQTNLERDVAFKVLPFEASSDPELVERFIREAKIVARLEHPHIVPVFDYDTKPLDEETLVSYIAMRMLTGGSLEYHIKQRGALPLEEALEITKQLANTLGFAHSKGIIHRDIKPSNIMFDEHGTLFIVDFGISKIADVTGLTNTHQALGTVEYMPPEQWGLDPVTDAADQWALAVVVYEMLTGGRMPFQAPDVQRIVGKVLNDPPVPIWEHRNDLPMAVWDVLERALKKEATERYPSIKTFAQELEHASKTEIIPEPAPATSSKRPIVAIVLLLLVGLIVGGGFIVKALIDSSSTPTAIVVIPSPTDTPTTITPTPTTLTQTPPSETPQPTPTPTNTPTDAPPLTAADVSIQTAFARAYEGVSTNDEWETWYPGGFYSSDEVTMVLVPIGCFEMGTTTLVSGYEDEYPARRICFDTPFWIDRYEVTNVQFRQFNGVSAVQSTYSADERPRTNVTWFEAYRFCALRGMRLPIEAEWEYVARGPSNLNYPWGETFIGSNVVDSNQPEPYGSRLGGMSWVGALDMIGNVWEWTSTLYEPELYLTDNNTGFIIDDGREAPENDRDARVLRGGGLTSDAYNLRAANRNPSIPSTTSYLIRVPMRTRS